MIKKLETAGLGYHVGAVDTYEKIGTCFKNLNGFSKIFHFSLFLVRLSRIPLFFHVFIDIIDVVLTTMFSVFDDFLPYYFESDLSEKF